MEIQKRLRDPEDGIRWFNVCVQEIIDKDYRENVRGIIFEAK